MEKKYVKVIDDDICNRKMEFKAKKWNNEKEHELQKCWQENMAEF